MKIDKCTAEVDIEFDIIKRHIIVHKNNTIKWKCLDYATKKKIYKYEKIIRSHKSYRVKKLFYKKLDTLLVDNQLDRNDIPKMF